MKNIVRFILYGALVYMLFTSDDILVDIIKSFAGMIGQPWATALYAGIAPGIFTWFLAGCFLNFCARGAFGLPNSALVLCWIVILTPYVIWALVAEGLVNFSPTVFSVEPLPQLLLCLAYLAGYGTINRIANH